MLKNSESGQGLIEYVLILVAVAVIVVFCVGSLLAWAWNLILVPLGFISVTWWQASLLLTAVTIVLSGLSWALLGGLYRLFR